MAIGANIRKRRYELKMTQQELANAMGYKNRATIARIESGENDVSHSKLVKFASILDTTVETLLAGDQAINLPSDTAISPVASIENKAVAVILAGGKSSRNLQNIPNQFISVYGKPIVVYAMEAYQIHPLIDSIYVVCLKGWESIVRAYAEQYHITKLKGIIPAGSCGILSLKNGFEYTKPLYDSDDIIVFQESTRPMVSVEIISKLLQACDAMDHANICMPTGDHLLFSISEKGQTIHDRNATVEVQSPEAYKIEFLEQVFKKAEQQDHNLTESCGAMLLYHLNYKVNFIEGSIENSTKIIRQEDIATFKSLIRKSDSDLL